MFTHISPQPGFRLQRGLWLLLLLQITNTAHAHGGPPAASGIAAASQSGPNLVILNEGLASYRGGRWSFLCPALWGLRDLSSGKAPLALSSSAGEAWIVGTDDVYAARNGQLIPQSRPELSTREISALVANEEGVYGLRIANDGGSEIVRIGSEGRPPLWRSPAYYSAIAADAEHFYLARQTTEVDVAFLVLDAAGRVTGESGLKIARGASQLALRPTPSGLFCVVSNTWESRLYRFDGTAWQHVLRGDGVLHGPQQTPEGSIWLVLNGVLMRNTSRGFETVGENRQLTCLGTWHGTPYACAQNEVYWLTNSGVGDRCFQLNGLVGPDPQIVPAPVTQDCQFQWELFCNDFARAGLSCQEWDRSLAQSFSPDARATNEDANVTVAANTSSTAIKDMEASKQMSSHAENDFNCSSLSNRENARHSASFALICVAMLALATRRRLRRPLIAVFVAATCVEFASPIVASPLENTSELDRRALAIATYDGGEVTVGEIEDAIANMSPLARTDLTDPSARRALFGRVLQAELMAHEAERRGYGARPAVLEAVKQNSVHRLLTSEVDAKLPPELRALDKMLPSPERDALIESVISPLRRSEPRVAHPELLSLIRLEPNFEDKGM